MMFTRQAHNITSDYKKIPHIGINGKVQNEIGRIRSYCVADPTSLPESRSFELVNRERLDILRL
jgi:hypothetical protein